MTVRTEDRSDVRIVTFDNPPVNAFSFAYSAEALGALLAAENDESVSAIVINGANGMFSGGADINDFGTQPMSGATTIRDVIEAIERSGKTYVAALERTAIGGGFEVALACDYRVAAAGTKVGFPEIRLGLIPGAGGTQRLTRLIGAQDALQLMLNGDIIDAQEARTRTLLDVVVDGDTVEAAILLLETTRGQKPKRRISERHAELGIVGSGLFATPFVMAQAHKMALPEERGGLAAHKLIDAVEAALEFDFPRGLAREYRLFDELVGSAQSMALRHVFFAERELGKIPGVPPAEPITIQSAGIVGAGTMGTGIAITFADAGIPTVVIEPNNEQIARAKKMVLDTFAYQVERGRLTEQEALKRGESIRFDDDYAALTASDLVIEAVFESIDVKKDVFAKLGTVCKKTAIFASNTSTLDIDAMAAASNRPQKFVGLHFFAPANIMKLLEVVRGNDTAPETLATAITLGKRLRKVAVLSANTFGFIANRMLFDYAREAIALAEEGVTPERIDRVIRDFGLAMGPFATFDLSGIDVFWHILRANPEAMVNRSAIIDRLYREKRLGQKTGIGFYRYATGKREPIPDATTLVLFREEAEKVGIAQGAGVTDAEIRERLITPLAAVGTHLLETGVALRPGDIDVVSIYGFGFPAYRGGPMWHAAETMKEVVHA